MATHTSANTGNADSQGESRQMGFLTLDETASFLRISRRSLQHMMDNSLPFYEPVPGRRLFQRDEVVRWLKETKRRVRGQ